MDFWQHRWNGSSQFDTACRNYFESVISVSMISFPHPLVTKVEQEYRILESLISELPKLYNNIADEIEQRAKSDAEAASDGDRDMYSTVYHSYDSAVDFVAQIPISANGYLLAAVYAFYERNVKEVYKELGIESRKVYPKIAFPSCNLSIVENKILYDQIDLIRLVRDNQSHGKLCKEEELEELKKFASRYKSIVMDDNMICFTDSRGVLNALERIHDFFQLVFKANAHFATWYIGGSKQKESNQSAALDWENGE